MIMKIPVFEPVGKFKICWDFMNMILIMIYIFFIPLYVVFMKDSDQLLGPNGSMFNLMSALYFLMVTYLLKKYIV